MSRSNPQNGTPNPSTRWFEWNGETGTIRYYDKDSKTNIEVALPFTFLLLDQLGSVRGWHKQSQSGIYSNEVRDTRADVMLVRIFKGGTTVAEGCYRDIKDRIKVAGGQFVANCYIAFKQPGNGLAIGSMRFKGSSLGAWMEFTKANRAALYKKAITIYGFTEGKTGRIVFRVPTFKTIDPSEATNAAALALDAELQTFLDGYLTRNKRDQVEPTAATDSAQSDEWNEPPPDDDGYDPSQPITDDDIPF